MYSDWVRCHQTVALPVEDPLADTLSDPALFAGFCHLLDSRPSGPKSLLACVVPL